MTYMPDFQAPFVFANFNGTSGDVDVITHECGHAFQGYLTADDPILEHADITMETAETHSMSMEFFTNPWMDLFFGDRADDFKRSQVEDAVAFIPYGCMVDEFQHIVYDHPEMTPARAESGLEGAWRRCINLIWTSARNIPSSEAGSYWQRQNHIYAGPFYYIDYCIAQTSAFQYRIWMEKDYRAAFDSYLKFSRESGSGFLCGNAGGERFEEPLQGGNDPGDRKRNPGTAVKYTGLKKSPRGGREKWRGKNSYMEAVDVETSYRLAKEMEELSQQSEAWLPPGRLPG